MAPKTIVALRDCNGHMIDSILHCSYLMSFMSSPNFHFLFPGPFWLFRFIPSERVDGVDCRAMLMSPYCLVLARSSSSATFLAEAVSGGWDLGEPTRNLALNFTVNQFEIVRNSSNIDLIHIGTLFRDICTFKIPLTDIFLNPQMPSRFLQAACPAMAPAEREQSHRRRAQRCSAPETNRQDVGTAWNSMEQHGTAVYNRLMLLFMVTLKWSNSNSCLQWAVNKSWPL